MTWTAPRTAPPGAWERPDWFDDAACAGMGADLFFPTLKGDNALEAKAVCQTCPVRVQCAAAGRHERFGLWGGVNMSRRSRYSRRVA